MPNVSATSTCSKVIGSTFDSENQRKFYICNPRCPIPIQGNAWWYEKHASDLSKDDPFPSTWSSRMRSLHYDAIIYSDTWEKHLQIMHKFLYTLVKAKLTVNLGKSYFCHATVEYLGHKVPQDYIAPIMAKVEAIAKFPIPTNKKVMITFYTLLALLFCIGRYTHHKQVKMVYYYIEKESWRLQSQNHHFCHKVKFSVCHRIH
jgi:hypothetical protein